MFFHDPFDVFFISNEFMDRRFDVINKFRLGVSDGKKEWIAKLVLEYRKKLLDLQESQRSFNEIKLDEMAKHEEKKVALNSPLPVITLLIERFHLLFPK